jgi:D-glycero-alpha-D-manno-heptose-7-phosphate kinase
LNAIRFNRTGGFEVQPVNLDEKREAELTSRLMLFFPGRGRLASEVAASVTGNFAARAANVRRMAAMVDEGLKVLRTGSLDDIGHMLHEAWQLKRGLSDRVSTEDIDGLYARARKAGAVGGKLLGAGGAGFMLFYVPPARQAEVRATLNECTHVPFGLDREGCRIIYSADRGQGAAG